MIVYLQRHIAAFTGQVTYMMTPAMTQQIVCITAGAPAGRIINLVGVGGLVGPGVLVREGGLAG